MTYPIHAAAPLRATILAALAALAIAAAPTHAQPLPKTAAPAPEAGKAAPPSPEAASLKKVLEQKFPGAEVRSVTKSPYFGLFEVLFDDRIIYTDVKAKYVLVGAIYDTEIQGQPDRGAAAQAQSG